MLFKTILILFQLIPFLVIGQTKLVKLPLYVNSNSSVSLTNDSNFLISTAGSKNFCLIRADLKKSKLIQVRTNLEVTIRETKSCIDGIIVTGILYPKNATIYTKVWLFVVKLDTCLVPVWQKMIELKEEYLDTTITNSNPIIEKVNLDNQGNIYLFTTSEHTNAMESEKIFFRNSAYIYKFNPNGELLFRKPILNRSHTNLDTKRTEFYNNHFYLTGMAFFPLFGIVDTLGQTYASRSVILKIDTSGTVVHSKIIEEEPYFTSGAFGLLINKKENQVLVWLGGRHSDSTRNYRESRELIMDLNLEIQKSNISNEKDSFFAVDQRFSENGKKEIFVYKKLQRTAQPGNVITRTGYGYLFKVDSNLKTIDSFALDFLTPSNNKDSAFDVIWALPNPLKDTLITFFGISNQNSSSYYYYAVNVNSKGQLIDSLAISNFPNLSCSLDFSNTDLFLSNFDTLVFTTKYNQNLKEPSTNIVETSSKQSLNLIPFPNPANSKVCFNDELKIKQASLLSIQGDFISHLNQENTCFKTPANCNNGMYLLKIILENGEVYFFKIQLQFE